MHKREDVKDTPKRKCPFHCPHLFPSSLPQRHHLISRASSPGQPPFRKVRGGSEEGMRGDCAGVGRSGQRRWEKPR